MPRAPLPANEAERLESVRSLCVMDTAPEPELDRITALAAELFRTPIAIISLVDHKRQWFKSVHGLEIRQTPRDQAFCAYALLMEEPLVVEDATRDPRFSDNPLVTGSPGIRFYAGAQILSPEGHRLGTLCVIDRKPRRWSERNQGMLIQLASIASKALQDRLLAIKAREASQAKGVFLASMSHEIRTPMNAVLGNAELLRAADISPAERDQTIDAIERNAKHLLELLNNILDFSKIEAGKLEPHIGPMCPAAILQEVRAMFENVAGHKGVSIRTTWDTDPNARFLSDALRVRQMLINLVGNAVKFTDKGTVTIAARSAPGHDGAVRLIFEVTDTGPGMSREQLAQLFRPFAQAGTHGTDVRSSTGLGLAISQSLARLLGGDIGVRSTPGQGTTFHFWIPAEPCAAGTDAPFIAPAPARSVNLHGRRILVVDDGVDNQRLMNMFLTKAGADVELATDGSMAVQTALDQSTDFDVIFMDVQMPVLDGLSATRQLREAGYGSPIVALTAFATEEDRARCLAAGCDSYLTKPIDRATLVEAAEAWCKSRGKAVA